MTQRVVIAEFGADDRSTVVVQNPFPNVTDAGLYQVCTSGNTDPGGIAIPTGAVRLVLWFEASASDATVISGRVGFNAAAAVVGSITGTDALLGYQPAVPIEYRVPRGMTHLHVANSVALSVAKGMWLKGE